MMITRLLCVLVVMAGLGVPQGVADTPLSSEISPVESRNQMIKITDRGLEPATLEMRKEDRIVFFVNDSSESLITLDVSFGEHSTHCSSENLRIQENGSIRSVKPIVPKDFATTCFHDAGTYPFTVYGLRGTAQGLRGSIIIR